MNCKKCNAPNNGDILCYSCSNQILKMFIVDRVLDTQIESQFNLLPGTVNYWYNHCKTINNGDFSYLYSIPSAPTPQTQYTSPNTYSQPVEPNVYSQTPQTQYTTPNTYSPPDELSVYTQTPQTHPNIHDEIQSPSPKEDDDISKTMQSVYSQMEEKRVEISKVNNTKLKNDTTLTKQNVIYGIQQYLDGSSDDVKLFIASKYVVLSIITFICQILSLAIALNTGKNISFGLSIGIWIFAIVQFIRNQHNFKDNDNHQENSNYKTWFIITAIPPSFSFVFMLPITIATQIILIPITFILTMIMLG